MLLLTQEMFLNLTDSKQVTIPVNTTFQNSSFNGQALTNSSDYKQDIYTSLSAGNRPYAVVASIRGEGIPSHL